MNITGKVIEKQKVVEFSSSFKKGAIILLTDEKYPQKMQIEFTQDNCDLLSTFNEGDLLSVSINIKCREWTNPQGEVKYFTSVQAWKVEKKEEELDHLEIQTKKIGDDLPF